MILLLVFLAIVCSVVYSLLLTNIYTATARILPPQNAETGFTGLMAARGAQTRKSDVDILIVMDMEKRFFERFEPLAELYDLFRGRALDLLIYTPAELQAISHRRFVRRICDEGKVLYES